MNEQKNDKSVEQYLIELFEFAELGILLVDDPIKYLLSVDCSEYTPLDIRTSEYVNNPPKGRWFIFTSDEKRKECYKLAIENGAVRRAIIRKTAKEASKKLVEIMKEWNVPTKIELLQSKLNEANAKIEELSEELKNEKTKNNILNLKEVFVKYHEPDLDEQPLFSMNELIDIIYDDRCDLNLKIKFSPYVRNSLVKLALDKKTNGKLNEKFIEQKLRNNPTK